MKKTNMAIVFSLILGISACAPEPTEENFNLAIKSGDLSDLKSIHDQGFNNNSNHQFTIMSAFQNAIEAGHVDVARFLMDSNYPARLKDEYLFNAVAAGNTELVSFLLEKGIDVNIKNQTGKTLIHLSIDEGNNLTTMFNAFKSANANFEAGNSEGDTPLSYALKSNKINALEGLIGIGVDLNSTNSSGQAPLHVAITNKTELEEGNSADFITKLIAAGADIDVKDSYGYTPLARAVSKNELKIAKQLIESGADKNIKTNDGKTPLIIAVSEAASHELTKLLVSEKVEINAQDSSGFSALHYTVGNELKSEESYPKIVSELIEANIDTNLKTNQGYTALMYAAGFNKVAELKVMLDKGVDLNVKNWGEGLYALDYARSHSNWNIANLLEASGAKSAYDGHFPAKPAPRNGFVTCNTNCRNGNCFRTYSDGRKINFQAKQKYNMFNNQWEWDSGSC